MSEKQLDSQPTLIIETGTDAESRRAVFQLLGDEAKRAIERHADNPSDAQWQTTITIPTGDVGDEMRLFARSRRDLESSIDNMIEALIDPAKACELYRYFAALKQRAREDNLEVAGDWIKPDGSITNIDAKTETIQ